MGIQEMDEMLLSPGTPPAEREEARGSQPGGLTLDLRAADGEAILPDEEEQWLESLMHMQGLSSFLDLNYESPNLRQITRIVRMRELDQIEDRLKERKSLRHEEGPAQHSRESGVG